MKISVYSGTRTNEANSINNLNFSLPLKLAIVKEKNSCSLYQILSDVTFDTVSISAAGKESNYIFALIGSRELCHRGRAV